jgi:hypothetical protein
LNIAFSPNGASLISSTRPESNGKRGPKRERARSNSDTLTPNGDLVCVKTRRPEKERLLHSFGDFTLDLLNWTAGHSTVFDQHVRVFVEHGLQVVSYTVLKRHVPVRRFVAGAGILAANQSHHLWLVEKRPEPFSDLTCHVSESGRR